MKKLEHCLSRLPKGTYKWKMGEIQVRKLDNCGSSNSEVTGNSETVNKKEKFMKEVTTQPSHPSQSPEP